jgi:phytoene desaturase
MPAEALPFGLQPTLRQSNHLRPQAKSMQCEGLYFTGSSTHPGAGDSHSY